MRNLRITANNGQVVWVWYLKKPELPPVVTNLYVHNDPYLLDQTWDLPRLIVDRHHSMIYRKIRKAIELDVAHEQRNQH